MIMLTFKPLTEKTWEDLERLFGERGACGGCWCMTYRLNHADYEEMKGPKNREAFHQLAGSGLPTGILAYEQDSAIGWCSVAPRTQYVRLETSRVLARVDDKAVWSIVCFFVDKEYRNKGVSKALINAAVAFAREHGATIIEAYPIIPNKVKVPPVFAFSGLKSAFDACGFEVVVKRSERRPIMRYSVSER